MSSKLELAQTTAPDPEPLKKQATDLMAQTKALKIVDDATYKRAAEIAKSWKTLDNEIVEKFKAPKELAHKAHKAITSLESELRATPREGEQLCKKLIADYQIEQEKTPRAEEQRLAEEAKKRRETEQLEEAARLEAVGEKEAAEEVVSREVPLPAVSLPKPKAAGVSVKMIKKFRVVDVTKIDPKFLIVTVDDKAIGALVTSMGERAAAVVGGIEVYEEPQVAVRAG